MLRIPALVALPWFLPGLAISVLVGFLVRRRVAAWLGASTLVGWGAVVTFGIVVSATLTPLHESVLDGAVTSGCDFSRMRLAPLREILELGDTALNVFLFIPLGAVLALVPRSRRKAWLIAGAIAMPVLIETTQLLAKPLDRACQSADVVDNVTGLLIGLAVGSVAALLTTQVREADAEPHAD